MIFEIIILILAFPIGFLISFYCKDELIEGRKWFSTLTIFGIVFGLGLSIYGFRAESLTSFFIAIISFVSYKSSFDKKFVKSK